MIDFAKLESDPKTRANALMLLNRGMIVAATTFAALLAYLCKSVL